MSQYRPSFAQNQLQKHGWRDGKGLGKSENGIKSAIKVKVKNNKDGLGHDAGSDFTFHWWDHIFNKAANTIEVVDDGENEVSIKKNENAKKIVPQLMYNKKPLPTSLSGKPLLYGTFVSAGTISTKELDSGANSPDPTSSESESEEEENYSTDLLDRAYKKTGLTGHKGARHGLKLSGKLKRIQEQERISNGIAEKDDKKIKKKKKEKKLLQENTDKDTSDDKDLADNTNCTTKSKKKKKLKRKHCDSSEENEGLIEEAESGKSEKVKKKKKKKKKEID